jgi:prolyl 4-hydroxylase
MDDFVTPEECHRLIEWGTQRGYNRSTDVGELKPDGTYTSVVGADRTSSNTWCVEDCVHDPLVEQVEERIFTLTGTPRNNSEYLQLLYYQVCAISYMCVRVSA